MSTLLRACRSTLQVGRMVARPSNGAHFARRCVSTNTPAVVSVEQEQQTHSGERNVKFTFSNGAEFSLSPRWVRDHCHCPACVSVDTSQRQIDYAPLLLLDPSAHGVEDVSIAEDGVTVNWDASPTPQVQVPRAETLADLETKPCTANKFSHKWLWEAYSEMKQWGDGEWGERHVHHAFPEGHDIVPKDKVAWDAAAYSDIDQQLRGALQFDVLGDPANTGHEDMVFELVSQLEKYGVAFVEGVPPSLDGTEQMVRSFGTPRPTIWGDGMWGTTIDTYVCLVMPYSATASPHHLLLVLYCVHMACSHETKQVVDFAYSNVMLHSHNDCTYLVDMPGYQILNCAQRVDIEGGVSSHIVLLHHDVRRLMNDLLVTSGFRAGIHFSRWIQGRTDVAK